MNGLRTAIVTGASRGIGRGVAIALDRAGYRVVATGRSMEAAELPPSIERVKCDHTRDEETAAAIERAAGQVDILVNAVWGGYECLFDNGVFAWGQPFWERPALRWRAMMDAGPRAALMASAMAAPGMIARRSGLIVNLSYWAARKYLGNSIYGVAKAATDKLTSDIAEELRAHGVAAISLYPGLVRTEAVLESAQWLDLSNSESPEFIGRVIAALADDPELMTRSGRVVVAAQAAIELGVADTDGRQPSPLTIDLA